MPACNPTIHYCVLPHVEAIAKGCKAGNVTFVHVVEPLYPRGGSGYIYNEEDIKRIESKNKAAAEKYLDQLVSRVSYDGINVQSEVITGKAAADSIADSATHTVTTRDTLFDSGSNHSV